MANQDKQPRNYDNSGGGGDVECGGGGESSAKDGTSHSPSTRNIVVEGRTFTIKEELLASNSEYFNALFSSNFKERTQKNVTLKDVESDVFEQILAWCEDKKIELSGMRKVLALKLLKTAALFLMEELRICLETFLGTQVRLNPGSWLLQGLDIASQIGSATLKRQCFMEVAEQFDSFKSEDFFILQEETILEVLRCPELNTSRDIVGILTAWFKNHSLLVLHELGQEIQENPWIYAGTIQKLKSRRLPKRALSPLLDTFEEVVNRALKEKKETGLGFDNQDMDVKHLGRMNDDKEARNQSPTTESLRKVVQIEEIILRWYDLISDINASQRSIRTFPAIISAKCEEAGPSSRRQRANKNLHVFSVRPFFREFKEEFEVVDLYKDDQGFQVFPTGCRVTSLGSSFVLSGGEYGLGRNSWNLDVLKYTVSTGECKVICQLKQPRRHHSAVQLNNTHLYLIGGFDKVRKILSSMEKIDLATGEIKSCAKLPTSWVKIAATAYKNEIVVVGGGVVYLYSPGTDSWRNIPLLAPDLSSSVDFHAALWLGDTFIYLTSSYSNDVYRFEMPDSPKEVVLQKVGKFKNEAQNPVGIENQIYNFYCSDFEDERTVERFELFERPSEDGSIGTSKTLLTIDDPALDFNALSFCTAFTVDRRP